MAEEEYVLGTDQDEIERLRRQHELWAPQARDLWTRADFQSKHKILDLGCGPGFTTLELAHFLGSEVQITAVDASSRFLGHLESRAKDELPSAQIRTVTSYVEKLELPEKDFDAAYCRWLMIFAPDVPAALRALHRHLKPGATFALQEYVAYETMQICPEVPVMSRVLAAIFKSWRSEGGDPNRGRELPQMLEQSGFRVREIQPISRIAKPQDPLWDWPDQFFANYLPKLVSQGLLNEADQREFDREWQKAKQTPGAFFLAPTMIDIIAERA